MLGNHRPIEELYLSYKLANEEKKAAANYVSWDLTPRQICDLELLLNGGFSPLKGFLNEEDYDSVVENMRLKDGSLWPIPITLDVSKEFSKNIKIGEKVALRNLEGVILATIQVDTKWSPDKFREANEVFQTRDETHPGVDFLFNNIEEIYLGGKVVGLEKPQHYDFKSRRQTPNELRKYFQKMGWQKIVAFQTRNPLHRAHQELTLIAARKVQANLLIHPVVGQTKPGDIDHFTRVRCYQKILNHFPEGTTMLSLLPLSMRMAGPREALWHGLIRKNYGCTHLVVGRDHAGPGMDSENKPFYGPYDAQNMLREFESEIGINMVPFKFMVYVPKTKKYVPVDEIEKDVEYKTLSGTELRDYLSKGKEIPEWFTFKAVARELERSNPPLNQRGLTVFFTGLSGSG